MAAVMMGNFEELVIPRRALVYSACWYVVTKFSGSRYLTNAGQGIMNVDGRSTTDGLEKFYFESEMHALISIKEYYEYHSKPFPYDVEIEILEKENGVPMANESQIMEFI